MDSITDITPIAKYNKVIDTVGRNYPDIKLGIADEHTLYSYAYAKPLEHSVYLIPRDLQRIVKAQVDLKFILLHEIGHIEKWDMEAWGRGDFLALEFAADEYACQHGITVKKAIQVLRRILKESNNKWALQARIEHLKRRA